MTTNSSEFPDEMKFWIGRCLARQETLHARLKFFNILGNRFRHGTSVKERMSLHQMAVEAGKRSCSVAIICYELIQSFEVCCLVQYDYENGHPPFDSN